MLQVFIPTSLRATAAGASVVPLEAATLREVVAELDRRFPGLGRRLCNEDGSELRPGLALAVDSRVVGRALDQAIPHGSEVHFVAALAGG